MYVYVYVCMYMCVYVVYTQVNVCVVKKTQAGVQTVVISRAVV